MLALPRPDHVPETAKSEMAKSYFTLPQVAIDFTSSQGDSAECSKQDGAAELNFAKVYEEQDRLI